MTEAVAQAPVELGVTNRLPLSRREFLNYMWAMSMAVFMAGSGGAAVWFLSPRFQAGEFGGVFTISVIDLPAPDSPPKEFPQGRFWLSYIGPATVSDPRQPTDYPLQVGHLWRACAPGCCSAGPILSQGLA